MWGITCTWSEVAQVIVREKNTRNKWHRPSGLVFVFYKTCYITYFTWTCQSPSRLGLCVSTRVCGSQLNWVRPPGSQSQLKMWKILAEEKCFDSVLGKSPTHDLLVSSELFECKQAEWHSELAQNEVPSAVIFTFITPFLWSVDLGKCLNAHGHYKP